MSRLDFLDLRVEIESAARSLGIEAAFRNVGPHKWQQITASISEAFLARGQLQASDTWWWASLKEPFSSHSTEAGTGYMLLDRLVPRQEVCWFLAEETVREAGKKWVFEGRVGDIQKVLGECSYFEYYLVSKRLQWLLAENHHGVLFAAGSSVRRLEELSRAS